jgi:hypothetical protein
MSFVLNHVTKKKEDLQRRKNDMSFVDYYEYKKQNSVKYYMRKLNLFSCQASDTK